MTKSDANYVSHTFEQMTSQNKAVFESVSDMQRHVKHIPQIQADIHDIKADIKILIAAIKDLSKVQKQQNYCLDTLEVKTAQLA